MTGGRIAFAVLLVLAGGGIALAQGSGAAKLGDPYHGSRIFLADGCGDCHGTVGQGGRSSGPRIARTELPFDAFLQQLRVPSNEMPPYPAKSLSDGDAVDVYAYLESLPAPPAVKDLSLLNP